MSVGIPVGNEMDSSLPSSHKTLPVVINYPIALLFVCLTKMKRDIFIVYIVVICRNWYLVTVPKLYIYLGTVT